MDRCEIVLETQSHLLKMTILKDTFHSEKERLQSEHGDSIVNLQITGIIVLFFFVQKQV